MWDGFDVSGTPVRRVLAANQLHIVDAESPSGSSQSPVAQPAAKRANIAPAATRRRRSRGGCEPGDAKRINATVAAAAAALTNNGDAQEDENDFMPPTPVATCEKRDEARLGAKRARTAAKSSAARRLCNAFDEPASLHRAFPTQAYVRRADNVCIEPDAGGSQCATQQQMHEWHPVEVQRVESDPRKRIEYAAVEASRIEPARSRSSDGAGAELPDIEPAASASSSGNAADDDDAALPLNVEALLRPRRAKFVAGVSVKDPLLSPDPPRARRFGPPPSATGPFGRLLHSVKHQLSRRQADLWQRARNDHADDGDGAAVQLGLTVLRELPPPFGLAGDTMQLLCAEATAGDRRAILCLKADERNRWPPGTELSISPPFERVPTSALGLPVVLFPPFVRPHE